MMQKHDQHTLYNLDQTASHFTPAFTFKIYNSLIALETDMLKALKVF